MDSLIFSSWNSFSVLQFLSFQSMRPLADLPWTTPAAVAEEAGPAQNEFDELVATHIKANIEAAKAVSPVLAEQLEKFLEACAEESRIIGAASRSAKPASMEALQALAKPLIDKAQEIAAYKDKYGRDKVCTHNPFPPFFDFFWFGDLTFPLCVLHNETGVQQHCGRCRGRGMLVLDLC